MVGDTLIEVRTEGAFATVNVAVLLFIPCADAVICAVPADNPLASPSLLIVALPVLLDHANAIPLIGAPFWSYPTAVNCCVPPVKIEDVVGVTTIVVNVGGGGSTVSKAGALLTPATDAVM